ncbi:MAG: hypothetical protein KKD39_04155 [Candidatus Altiarchaeota archaeon]|nr:hypothetical protein [Candidatus Altiarchaeota archaeon]
MKRTCLVLAVLLTLGCIWENECGETVCIVDVPRDTPSMECSQRCHELGYSKSSLNQTCTALKPQPKECIIQCSYFVVFDLGNKTCCCREIVDVQCEINNSGCTCPQEYGLICSNKKPKA